MVCDPRHSSINRPIPFDLLQLDFVTHDDRLYLADLFREFLADQVVLFAGAGLSKNAACRDGGESRMPDWLELAKIFRSRLGARLENERDVLKITDYYEAKYGRTRLVDDVTQALRDEDHLPGRVHEQLVELNFPEIITTNFDTLIERAFRKLHISPQVVISDSDLALRRKHPRILKINGCLTHASKIVLTGNDFLAYGRNHPLLEVFITKCFVESTVLFVGFSLDDPAFRILNERVVSTLGPNCRQAYSLRFGVTEEQRAHWSARKVQLIDLASVEAETLDCEDRLFQVLRSFGAARRRMRSPRGDREQIRRRQRRSRSQLHEQAESAVRQLWQAIEDLRSLHPRRNAESRDFFRRMLESWTLDGLAVNHLDRCKFLTFAALFAPLPTLVRLVDVWIGPDSEKALIHSELTSFQPTPEEYRIPLLGFCGLLEQSPQLYVQAADSLWARQLDVHSQGAESHADDDNPLEVAFRLRYLMQPDRLDDWRTSELQLERLKVVLRHLFFENGTNDATSVDLIEDVLTDLLRGWVFGSSEAPESFRRLWDVVRRDVAESNSESVPWELLTILTLMIEGKYLDAGKQYLDGAWHRGELDLAFLAEYVALRLEGVSEGRLDPLWLLEAGREDRTGSTPQKQYEEHLARFIRWLCESADSETIDSPDRRCVADKLAEPLYRWAAARSSHWGLRRSILESLAAVVALYPEPLGPQLQKWLDEELPPAGPGLNELARLIRVDGEKVIGERHVAQLLRGIPGKGHRLPVSTWKWLLRWYSVGPRKKQTRNLVGRVLANELLEESRTGSLGWLSLAAGIQQGAELRRSVETSLRKRHETRPESLFGFVKVTLLPILEDLQRKLNRQASDDLKAGEGARSAEDYVAKVAAFHQNFAPFAAAVDAEFLEAVLTAVDAENPYTRDGTAAFLAALLSAAPRELHDANSKRWKEDLERLIIAGATGHGTLGPLVSNLSDEASESLQDNLAAVSVRRAARNDAMPVEQILETLTQAPPGSLPALEEALVELLASPSRKVADACLAGILGPVRDHLPGFFDRHRRRLRRVRAVVRARGGYRPTSKFAAWLEELEALR